MSRCPVVEESLPLLLEAARLHNSESLSWWDALIIAAALEAGVGILYSEDLQNNGVYAGVKVVNPFLL